MNIKNITFGIFCVGALFSCTKEDMEVQKNTDLTWEVKQDLVNEDIRTSIGYDPRYTYVVPNISTVNYSVVSLGDLVFPKKETKILKVNVLGKATEKDIKVTLEYDPSLYQELNTTKYGGYTLGDSSLVKIDENQKTIPAGETSVEFQLLGDFSDSKKMIIPYTIKVESEGEIKNLGEKPNQFVVVTNTSTFLDNEFFIQPSKGSEKFLESFNKLKEMPIISKQYSSYPVFLEDHIAFKELNGRKFVVLSISFAGRPYPCQRYVDVENTNFSFTLKESTGYWNYFSTDLDNVLNYFNSNAPYKYEKVDDSTVKVISVKDPDIWFTIEKE